MKKLLAALIFVGGIWSSGLAADNGTIANRNLNTAAGQVERIAEISARVEQIREIDRRSVSKSEWKEIREELKKYKKELKEMKAQQPYIYISLTALLLIIIIILLIA